MNENIGIFDGIQKTCIGLDHDLTAHELNFDPTFKPMNENRCKLVNNEVYKLLMVGSIHEVKYLDWLFKPVVFKNKNGK